MGEVWRGRDTKLGREVAIKTLPAEFAQDAGRLAPFEREANLLIGETDSAFPGHGNWIGESSDCRD